LIFKILESGVRSSRVGSILRTLAMFHVPFMNMGYFLAAIVGWTAADKQDDMLAFYS
jgi:phosphotransferase system  glucose/maltose/N-acetylglucosamine-specific IIC component